MTTWLRLFPDVSVRVFSEICVAVTVRGEDPPSVWMGPFQLAAGPDGAQRQKDKFPLANRMKHLSPARGWQNWGLGTCVSRLRALGPPFGLRLRDASFVCLVLWLSKPDHAMLAHFPSETSHVPSMLKAYPKTTHCSFQLSVCLSSIY